MSKLDTEQEQLSSVYMTEKKKSQELCIISLCNTQ